MNSKVNLSNVRACAENYFRSGGFYCSEAIVVAIRDQIDPQMPKELIAAASGFPVGIGKSKCVCGAVSGAVICLGYFFGRTAPSTPQDERSVQTLLLTNELQQSFRDNHKGVLCCSVHTKNMDMGSGEHKCQCVSFTGEMAEKVAGIICRALHLDVETNPDSTPLL